MARSAVLLHGFTGSADSWSPKLLRGIDGLGYRVRTVDLPGHGARGREEGVPTLDATVAEIADVLEGGDALIGYSMGGRVALHVALRHPDRVGALVLESASPGIGDATERRLRRDHDERLAASIVQDGVPAFVDRWEGLPLFASQRRLDSAARAEQRRRRLANDARGLAFALRGLGTGVLPSLWNRLAEVVAPTLLLVGALDDKFVDIAERMAASMKAAEVEVVPDVGHAVHVEAPDAWADVVARFLSRKAPAAGR